MSKVLNKKNLTERRSTPALVAVSLAISMAAFGCTTDRHLGNGDPVTTPGIRTSPTGDAATGSETAPTTPPMTSSSRFDSPVRTGRIHRVSADEAAAIMAANQSSVRVLGPASPGTAGQRYVSDGRTNVFAPGGYAALVADPALLIAGETGALVDGSAGGLTSTGSAGVAAANGVASLTPTGAAIPLPAGAFAMGTGTFTPTAASVVNPPASISGLVAPAVTNAQTPGVTAASTVTTTAPTVTTQSAVAAQNAVATATVTSAAAGTIANPVRLSTGANGKTVITNTATRTTTSSRSQ